MKSLYRYSVLLILCIGIIAVLGFTLSGPVIYSLEKDIFPSLFHENTDALKVREFNSTTDILPLMQDLLDYDGPISLNINIRDMDQVRYYLDQYSKNNIRLRNLVINLDMTDSEMDEFSQSKHLQQKLLAELMNSTIAMDELDSLMIVHRDDSGMIMSLELQREAILKRMQEISEQYRLESEKTQKIADDAGLDTSSAKESVREVQRVVDSVDKKTPVIQQPLPRIPTLSLLVNPETGKYSDSIRFSGVYISSTSEKIQYPVTLHIDSGAVVPATTDPDGIYSTQYEIGQITPGEHSVYATSGITSSAIRTFSVLPVNSTTSLDIRALYNKPVILANGLVLANRPVRNAPVDIIADYHTILRQTTNKNGAYQAQIRLSPGTHSIQARFVNDTYPVYQSGSPLYEVEAGRDSILSIRLRDANMSADELSLTLEPASASYNDVINITGFLSGKDPKSKVVDLFIDGVYSLGLQTGPDGSFANTYAVEKIRAGNHTLFAHYREPEAGEIFSPSRPFVVNAAESVTVLDIGMAGDGTRVICTGNVSALGKGVSSAPVELVWDSRNIIRTRTDETGSFRQTITLPVGNHSIFARFTSQDYPLIPSRSVTSLVTVPPPLDLFVRPPVAYYRDTLTIGGSLRGVNPSGRDVQIFIDGKKLGSYRTDAGGNYSTQFTVETIPDGTHRVYARSGEYTSETESFTVHSVNSTINLSARLTNDNTRVISTGQLHTEAGIPVHSAPVFIIWDDNNRITTTTDNQGRFEETLSLPAGSHQLVAQFENRELYPIHSSKSAPVNIEIQNPIILRVQPDYGKYLDTLTISGEIHGATVSRQDLPLFIDGKKTQELRSDSRSSFATPYTIEQIRGGMHTIQVRSGDIRSDAINFTVVVVQSTTTLSAVRNGETSSVTCSGTVTANNKPVRLAPVLLVWDEKNIVRTTTDEKGKYNETIVLPAGKHQIKAQFNSPDRFPLYPSESAVVIIEIPHIITVGNLVLEVMPKEGRFMEHITIGGTLTRNRQIVNVITGRNGSTMSDTVKILTVNTKTPADISGKPVSVSMDGKLLGTYLTDNNGEFFTGFIIEEIRAGIHTVYALSAGVQSQPEYFTVLMANSTTTLSAVNNGENSLVFCSGTVTANDEPVRSAPVTLIWDGLSAVNTTTDKNGTYNETIALPAGKHQIKAQFNNPDLFPLYPSESAPVEVEISAPLSVSIQPDYGKYRDILTINGSLHTDVTADRDVRIFIDEKQTGSYRTDSRGHFTTTYEIEKISGGQHTLMGISNDLKSDTTHFFVVADNSTTTLSAQRTGSTSEVFLSGTVTTDNQSVRAAPVTITWDGRNSLETSTDNNGVFSDSIILPAGVHQIQAQFNSTGIFPVYSSNSTVVEITILPELSLDVKPSTGIYHDTLLFEGTLIRPDSPESTVDLFIDNNLLAAAKTDRTGRYSYAMTIEKMPAGSHFVQAQSAGLQSDVRVFQVLPVQSRTTLTIAPVNNSSLYECTGRIMAFDHAGELIRKPLTLKDAQAILAAFWDNPLNRANLPAGFAPVAIIANNETLLQTMTDAEGYFSERVAFAEGDTRVTAQFINDSYPIFSSTSGRRVVNVPTADSSVQGGTETPPQGIPGSLVIPVILLLFVGGAGYYLNRRSALFSRKIDSLDLILPPGIPGESSAPPELPGETGQPADTSPPELPAEDPIFTRYLRIRETDGVSTAARAVYVHFTGTITRSIPVRNHLALTPREFLHSCDGKPFFTAFSSFISLYERVRYGGTKNSATTGEFEESIRKTDQSLEGEDH
jgi:hypothetical protein